MAPLQLHEVRIGPTKHIVGIFGSTLSQSIPPMTLLERMQPVTNSAQVTFQAVNAAFIASPDHLLFAAMHALTAFHRGTNRASTLATEILRFAAAQRQISKALDTIGLDASTQHVGGVLIHTDAAHLKGVYQEFLRLAPATDTPSVLEIASNEKLVRIQKLFQITDLELEAISSTDSFTERTQAVQKLIYDRCALLAISH